MIMDIVFIIIISVLVIWICSMLVILHNNYLFNAVFNRKQREVWKFVIRNVDKFNYIGNLTTSKVFRWNDYLAIVWDDNTCSIHIDGPIRSECIAIDFDKVMSNKMRNLLLNKIK